MLIPGPQRIPRGQNPLCLRSFLAACTLCKRGHKGQPPPFLLSSDAHLQRVSLTGPRIPTRNQQSVNRQAEVGSRLLRVELSPNSVHGVPNTTLLCSITSLPHNNWLVMPPSRASPFARRSRALTPGVTRTTLVLRRTEANSQYFLRRHLRMVRIGMVQTTDLPGDHLITKPHHEQHSPHNEIPFPQSGTIEGYDKSCPSQKARDGV